MCTRNEFLLFVASYLAVPRALPERLWEHLVRAREIPPEFFLTMDPATAEQCAFEFVAWVTGWGRRPAWLPLNAREQAYEETRQPRR